MLDLTRAVKGSLLKSDLRGIETGSGASGSRSAIWLKSDLRGIETYMHIIAQNVEHGLKSDLRGIETLERLAKEYKESR